MTTSNIQRGCEKSQCGTNTRIHVLALTAVIWSSGAKVVSPSPGMFRTPVMLPEPPSTALTTPSVTVPRPERQHHDIPRRGRKLCVRRGLIHTKEQRPGDSSARPVARSASSSIGPLPETFPSSRGLRGGGPNRAHHNRMYFGYGGHEEACSLGSFVRVRHLGRWCLRQPQRRIDAATDFGWFRPTETELEPRFCRQQKLLSRRCGRRQQVGSAREERKERAGQSSHLRLCPAPK